jgi:hypothetical protein
MEALGGSSNSKGILLQQSQLTSKHHVEILESNEIYIREVNELTKGQADSALISLSSGLGENCIVGTCDSLVFPRNSDFLPKKIKTLGVWITKPSEFAIKNPKQFGNVSESWIKEEPPFSREKFVISGTFYFGDVSGSIELLRSFLLEGSTVNGEYYLDSLLEFARGENWQILGLIPEWFISLGTPDEYETYVYWENLFNQRPDLLIEDHY